MVTRDLRFNIFANDRASAAFARVSAAADAVSARLAGLDGRRVRARIEADTSQLEAKLAQAEAHLDRLQRRRTDPRIDANIALAQAKIIEVTNRLQELDKKRIRPEVQAQIGQSQARIAQLEQALERLGRMRPSPVVTMQTALARNEIANIQRRIDELNRTGADPKVMVDIAVAEAQITRLRGQINDLNRMRASPEVDADIAAAEAKIAHIKRQIEDLRTRGATVRIGADVDGRAINSFLGRLNDLRHAFQNNINAAAQLTRNIRQLVMPVSLAGFIPTFASIGASIETAAGAMALLPGAAGAAAAAVGTLALGFHGLLDAIGPRDTGTQIKNADREMSRLGENAQAVAKAVIGLKDEWNFLKKAVQDNLFKDVAPIFEKLARQWMPVLQDGLGELANEFNKIGKDLMGFMAQASTIDDTNAMFEMFRMTVANLGPAFRNIGAAFMDLAVVGSSFLPGLAQGFTNLTARFAAFIQQAREDGSLQLWIAQGMVAISEFGDLLANVGGIFGAAFDAARKSGDSFISSLTALTGGVREFLESAQGQAGMIALFQGIRDAIDSIMPGLKAIGSAIAESFQVLQPAVSSVGTAFSEFAAAVAPTLVVLSSMVVDVVVPLAQAFAAVSSALGPVVPAVLALAVAFRALTGIGAMFASMGMAIAGFSTSVGMAALAMGASGKAAQGAADSTSRLGNALTRMGNSLPLIGTAVIGLVLLYEEFGSKADEVSKKVVNGSMTIAQAIAEEINQVERNQLWWNSAQQQKEAYAAATARVRDAVSAQLAVMDPLARATAEVSILEGNYNDQLRIHGENSREASTAAEILKAAKERLVSETARHTDATKTNTEALIENSNAVMAAANADVNLERANLNLEQQQRRTAEALREHGAASLEGRQATLDLQDAYLRAAEAAGRKAQADAEARGEADAAAQGARAYQQRLMELASTADGPTRDALLKLIANLDTTKSGANDAALAALGLKDDIDKLPPSQATTFTQPGMDAARANVRGLQSEVGGLKDTKFKITATGEVLGAGNTGLATGGVIPGYTPGRDVHEFFSPTAGRLGLSGGEAVMRPEWTRAVGPDYVNMANRAARTNGVTGVLDFLTRTAPRPGEGMQGDGSAQFANGGIIQRFATGGIAKVENPVEYKWQGPTITQWFLKAGADLLKKMFAAGGGNALAWARTQVGKPYVWGGVGPGGYDCSGFMSAIVNVIRGKPPHSRVGATGNFPWAGFRPGLGPGLSIGAFKGNPGHMAGSINGTPVESSGGAGVRVGGGARGAGHGMFNIRAHLPFDDGGMARGTGWLQKLTPQPERVLSPDQTNSFERLVGVLDSMRTSPSPSVQQSARDAAATEVQRLRADMAMLNETIRSSVATARPITVEDRSGNPVETARAVSLAMRL